MLSGKLNPHFDSSARDSPAKHPSRTVTSRDQHELEQRRRSQVRADAGSLADPRGACGACHGDGAAAAEPSAAGWVTVGAALLVQG